MQGSHVIRIAAAIVVLCLAPQAQAPKHISIDERPYRHSRVLRVSAAIARAENCLWLNNPGCIIDPGSGNYRAFRSIEDGMRAIEHEVLRRRGMTIREILKDYNPDVDGYAEFVASVGGLDLEEVIR